MKTTKNLPEQDRVFSLRYYWHGLPEILYYQIPAKIILFMMVSFAEGILGSIMNLTGIYSVSSGELPSLLRSWYGWAVLIALSIVFTIYMALDIIILILLSRNILYNQKKKMREIISTAIRVSRKFINFRGCLIGMYFAVIIPLNTAMIGLRLTKHAVPQFIYSVIRTNYLYMLAYVILVLLLDFVGIIHIFTFHGVLFDNYSLATSMHESRSLFFKNWKNVILSYLKFFGMFLLILVVGVVSIIVIPYYVSHWIMQVKFWYHYLIIMVVILGLIFIFLFTMIFIQAQAMCITRVYDECTLAGYQEEKFITPVLFQKSFRFVISISLLASLLLGYVGAMIFDDLFPKEYATEVIAHRGGGDLSTENTVESIRAAIEAGATASEIDVQRTADGHYVIFHDNTLKRLCDDPRTIQELTLEEIKKLRITAPDGHQVRIATLEEILNTAKDEIKLYIELKGKSAGMQMANDVYQMLEERDMVNQVRIISLNANLISQVERTYPDVETEYLCFIAYGEIETMEVDAVGLEEELATSQRIDNLHKAGKKVDVWTANSFGSIIRFMVLDVDGIITDSVQLALNIRDGKSDLPDFTRLLRIFFPQF
ncbi:glycerophosphodiester phosphodiesterase family protein [uncultured Solobacterium sp.]|jgi:glycerophosphodiester phosphodiesterase family protein|uniref:glycerophosphodiester phosphodiesterase family protein n=1 Tax=uncultured Solobacterium sp. TaxID=747375 RepID=UPI002607119C|nr:glycerophosphodiester phosphodiesterase family protein [uncultured Solobacterium sp.]